MYVSHVAGILRKKFYDSLNTGVQILAKRYKQFEFVSWEPWLIGLRKTVQSSFNRYSRMALSPLKNISETRAVLKEDWNSIEKMIAFSVIVISVFFGGIGGWASFAPLDSAVVVPGRITVSSHRQSINHSQGGVVRSIFVKDGDRVSDGQLLVQLDDTEAKVQLQRLTGRQNDLLNTKYRLLSENKDASSVRLPDQLTEKLNDPLFLQSYNAQMEIFQSRKEYLAGQNDIRQQNISQLELEIGGYESQLDSTRKQKALLSVEINALRSLYKKKYIGRQRLLALRREYAEISGIEGELHAKTAATKKSIGETKLMIVDLRNSFKTKVADELGIVKSQLADITEQIIVANELLKRTAITAPVSGTVFNLQVHTAESSIEPGASVLDIVPENDSLLIQASIDPMDIDVVHKGLPVRIHMVAYGSRYMLPVNGVVTHVSADSLTDQRSGEPHFVGHIKTFSNQAESNAEFQLLPGMPVEVVIVTGKRTALDYLVDPIVDSFRRAGREQ